MTGRQKESEELNRLYDSDRAQLVAVYGRRRVGKTYLVDETFAGRFTFRHTGLSPVEMEEGGGKSPLKNQLRSFYHSLVMQGMKPDKCPGDWLEAFFLLEKFLQDKDDGSRQLVFLDELPWMDTPRSGFITAFESFWNGWGCHRHNLMVIVCGSATSWIMDKLVNNHGGLYGRLTYEIRLSPFTLAECRELFESQHVKFSGMDVVQSYMIVGGLPYYLGYFEKGLSLPQNVDLLFFGKNARLRNEFDRLFSSVFTNPETMKTIIRLLSTRGTGFTRKEISEKTGYSGAGLTEALNALLASDFIDRYIPFRAGKREERYQITDPFCMFYLRFVDGKNDLDDSFWQLNNTSAGVTSWRGFAFENVCCHHIRQIKEALGISGISTRHYSWAKKDADAGTQADLLIERKDNIINMCEMKYYGSEFAVTKDYYRTLMHRQTLLEQEISPRFRVHNTLITTFGLKYNEYSGFFDNVITLEDLFR